MLRRDIDYLMSQDERIERIEAAILDAIAIWIAIGTLALGLSLAIMGKP